MKLGAYDFVIKTVDLEAMDAVINRALELLSLQRRLTSAVEHDGNEYAIDNVIAESAAMQQLLTQVRDVAQNPKATVLLQGETGTGKEFIARVLHHNSPRQSAPFIGVNCTAIPRELFESELFGYERGAFTGANQRKLGLLEKAEGGTLFLDEIGDLDPSMQAKLLRVLQERSFRRLGGMDDISVDFRLVAATNRDLKKEVARGAFREDLYFRLNVVLFDLPPLRHRIEDIVPLCHQALLRYGKDFGKEVLDIDPEARAQMERYSYPGNVRELQNIIERALIFCQGKTLTANYLPSELRERAASPAVAVTQGAEQVLRVEMPLGKLTLAELEAAVIEEVLRLSGHNKTQAAKHLGLTRFALDRRLKKIIDD
jgi:two-component system response regulator AtoC